MAIETGTAPRSGAVEPKADEASELRSIYALLERTAAAHPRRIAYRFKRDGGWTDVSWADQRRAVRAVSAGLAALGVVAGERVGILSPTRLEWIQSDFGIVGAGAVTVGIYPSNLAPDCAYILEHSGAVVLFVADRSQLDKVRAVRDRLPRLRHVVVYDLPVGEGEGEGVLGWTEFLRGGESIAETEIDARGGRIAPGDLASLVYTSGTTGVPKGAMISHGNLLFVARAAGSGLDVAPEQLTLLFLPLAHVFARMLVYMCVETLVTVALAEDLTTVAANLREVRPHFIAGVPRVYEKFHEKILAGAEQGGARKKKIFRWAIDLGHEVAGARRRGEPVGAWLALRHRMAEHLVLRKVREALGGRLEWAVSGAAPLNPQVAEFFEACGLPLVEGLGMTENTSLSNVNPVGRNKLGTVGPTVPGVEMKLDPDGEVLFRGPNVMLGYYENPEATAATIDPDGWLRSGDIGEIDEDGYLKITDRKKDLIITAGGKNIAPQRIEKVLRGSRYISQAVAYGDRRKYVTART